MDVPPDAVLLVTHHAVQRYRERFDPRATAESVEAALRTSDPAPAWVRKNLPVSGEGRSFRLSADGLLVFVIAVPGDRRARRRGELHAVTVFPAIWVREKYQQHGKKRYKRNPAGWRRSFG